VAAETTNSGNYEPVAGRNCSLIPASGWSDATDLYPGGGLPGDNEPATRIAERAALPSILQMNASGEGVDKKTYAAATHYGFEGGGCVTYIIGTIYNGDVGVGNEITFENPPV